MKKYFFALGVVLVAILGATSSALALITCPAGSHTFSGGTQASGYDMCIPDVGPSGPVSGSSGQSGATFTPSTKGTITPSGTTAQTQTQGIAIDTQVYLEVNRLYGTSIYAQAKALYDASVSVNTNDFNSVANQVKNVDDDTADALKRAYNVRAIERLNQVWNQILALETTYAEQQKQQAITPPATTPTPISPTPITPTPISPTPINPTPISPTPINPTPISPTPITPTPISPTGISPTPINPTPIIAHYYNASDIKPGQTITAPADQKTNIITASQKIDLKEGSTLKLINKLTWHLVSGVAHFVEKMENVAAAKRMNVKTTNAVATVRGTQYTVNASAPDKTIITVTKGTVNVAPTAKGKKAVDVKEGYQVSVDKNGAGKPAKINTAQLDAWYESVPADSDFLNSSWSKAAAANRYRRDCVYTTAAATAAQTLTADEQKIVDAVNQGLAVFRVKTSDLVMEKDKKVSSAKEKTNLDGAVSMQLYLDAKNIYYPGDKAKTWKVFQNKKITDALFKMLRQENMTYNFDKSTFTFDGWQGTGKNRLAVYSGHLTGAGASDVISSASGQAAEEGQTVGTAKIYLNEESQLWDKTEVTIDVLSGKIIFPLYQTCQITYGDAVKVAMPSKAKKVDAKTGNAEFGKAVASVR